MNVRRQTVIPLDCFFEDAIVQSPNDFSSIAANLFVVNVLDLGRVVAILLIAIDHFEAAATDGAENGTTVAQQHTIAYVEHGTEVRVAHTAVMRLHDAKLTIAAFDGTPNH